MFQQNRGDSPVKKMASARNDVSCSSGDGRHFHGGWREVRRLHTSKDVDSVVRGSLLKLHFFVPWAETA